MSVKRSTAKCSKCGVLIFDKDGQRHGEQLIGGGWVCSYDCGGRTAFENWEQIQDVGRQYTKLGQRFELLEKFMRKYAEVEDSRLKAYEDLDDKHDVLVKRVAELEGSEILVAKREKKFTSAMLISTAELLALRNIARVAKTTQEADMNDIVKCLMELFKALDVYEKVRER